MPQILVVDDSPTDRMIAGTILLKDREVSVSYASDGAEAMSQIQQQIPDVVVTDLQMPELDGLQLVACIKQSYPLLPVILMTAQGSESIASEALRLGATSYVPKALLARQLRDVVSRIVASAAADRGNSRLMHSLAQSQSKFILQNDPGLIEPLVNHLQEMLRCLPLADESERLRVGIAVKHAVLNALYHGNLELPADVEDVSSAEMQQLVDERLADPKYADRTIVVESKLSTDSAEFHVQHQGPGFDAAKVELAFDVTSSSFHLTRGWILIRSIMDEVHLSEDGRRQSLIKHALDESELMFVE